MLLRYARSQFLDPNAGSDDWENEVAENKNFYGNDSDQVSLLNLNHMVIISVFHHFTVIKINSHDTSFLKLLNLTQLDIYIS